MSRQYPLFIKDAKSTGIFREVRSPFDGSEVASVERTDAAALEQALRNAFSSFSDVMIHMPAYRRAAILYKVADLIRANRAELALTIAREGGKPLKDAEVEVNRAANTTKMSGDQALSLNGETLTMDRSAGTENHLAYTVRSPVGPVLAISAFNHPLNLICHQVCTAFAAGNAVIVKPASQTPLSCLKMAHFFQEAGLPDGVLSVATASGSETDTLVQDSRIKFVTFIGGEDVGWNIRKKIKPGVRLALEHGGSATAILHHDADLSLALPSIIKGSFYHAGQVCVSTQIVNVHQDICTQVIDRLKDSVEKLSTGDPVMPETDIGPLIAPAEVERIDSWIKEALNQGAKLICGGGRLENNCYQPTILGDTNRKMKVVCREIFGPVLCLQTYHDIDQVIDEINTSKYSFQAAIYTKDIDLAHTTARQIDCKACMVNTSTAFRVDWMPFGGAKSSGLGVAGTRHAVYDMTEEKLIVLNIQGGKA